MESKNIPAKESPYDIMESRFTSLFSDFWTNGKEEPLEKLLDSHCRIEDFTSQSNFKELPLGPAGMKQLAQKLKNAFSDFKVELKMVLTGAEEHRSRTACYITFQGHHSGVFDVVVDDRGTTEQIHPTGGKFHIAAVCMTKWNDSGKMTEFKLACDLLALIRNCGWEADMNQRLAREIYERIFNKGVTDKKFLSQYFFPDCEINDPATPFIPSTVQGEVAFDQCISSYHRAFKNLHYEIRDMFCGGNKVIVHWHATGVHKGRFLDREPNGQCFGVNGIATFTFISGKVKKYVNHWDLTTLYKQLGELHKPE